MDFFLAAQYAFIRAACVLRRAALIGRRFFFSGSEAAAASGFLGRLPRRLVYFGDASSVSEELQSLCSACLAPRSGEPRFDLSPFLEIVTQWLRSYFGSPGFQLEGQYFLESCLAPRRFPPWIMERVAARRRSMTFEQQINQLREAGPCAPRTGEFDRGRHRDPPAFPGRLRSRYGSNGTANRRSRQAARTKNSERSANRRLAAKREPPLG